MKIPKLKILPTDWDSLIFAVLMIWLLIYLISGLNLFSALYELATDFSNYTLKTFIIFVAMVVAFLGLNRMKYSEIEGWAKFNSLSIKKIEAKNLFSDRHFFKNYSRTQFYVYVESTNGDEGIVLFQFGFRIPTNPNKIWVTDSLKDGKNKTINNDVSW